MMIRSVSYRIELALLSGRCCTVCWRL